MLLLLFTNQPAPSSAGYINATALIGDLWPPLNANGPTDAVFWTQEQMIEWFNEAAARLSSSGGVFVVRDTSIVASLGVPTYAVPGAHQATIQADFDGAVLNPRTVQELEALDATWPATTGAPEAFLLDVEGVKKITLYRKPDAGAAGKTLGLVMRALPDDVTAAAGILAAPPCLSEYFTFSILAEARSTETRAQMPEIAAWLKGLAGMMLQATQQYLGGA